MCTLNECQTASCDNKRGTVETKKFIGFKESNYEDVKDFGRNQQNRLYDENHLKEIRGRWLEDSVMIPPIQVNALTNNIIEGQHRWKSYTDLIKDGELPKDTKIKVLYYQIPEEDELDEITNANIHVKGWSLDDYIHRNVTSGSKAYLNLEEWCKEHSLCYKVKKTKNKNGDKEISLKYRYGAAILTGKGCRKELQKGTFTFTEEQRKIANEVHGEMLDILTVMNKRGVGAWIESMAIAWHEVRHFHPFSVWMKEFKLKKNRLAQYPSDSKEDWKNIFNDIHGSIDRKNLVAVAA